MPVTELALVIEAIIGIAVEGTLDQAKHHEAVLKVRQMLRRKLGDPEPEIDSVYAHVLIEYGIGKPRPLLEFFRYEFVRDAFEQAFHERDWTLIEKS